MIDNLNYYKVFLAVVRTGSISRAANTLYISQPAVSKAIANLEDSLKTKLFERNKQGVTLTEEGEIIYQHVKEAFDSIKNAEDEVRRIKELGIGTLKIGVSTSLCKHILLDYLKDFINDNPHIKLIIDCHSTKNTIKLLNDGLIDLGFICKTDLPKDFEYRKLRTIHDIFVTSDGYLNNLKLRENPPISDVVNPWLFAGNVTTMFTDSKAINNETIDKHNHKLDTSDKNISITDNSISVSDNNNNNNSLGISSDNATKADILSSIGMTTKEIIEKSNLMLLEKGNVTRNHIDSYLYQQDISPNQILEINNMDLLIDFAAIGLGVSSIVQEFATEQLKKKEIIALPLDNPVEEREVGFVYKNSRQKPPVLEKFLSYCF